MAEKKILILVSNLAGNPDLPYGHGFRDTLRDRLPGWRVEMSGLTRLVFLVDGPHTKVYDPDQGFDVADFDLVVFRTIRFYREKATAVAAYCRKKGVQYIDEYISQNGTFKSDSAMLAWERDLAMPATLVAPADKVLELAERNLLGWPLIVKAEDGRKGQENYLIHTYEELRDTFTEHPEVHFVLQQFIPNEGDYRILVFNYKPALAVLRRAKPGSHLNNTSQGASSQLVPLSEIPRDVQELACRAALHEKIAIAGVDVVVDARTSKAYLLEVNKAPQISTGSYVEEKIQAYAVALRERVLEAERCTAVSGF